jgi:flagellar hook-associated protein 2
MTISNIQFNNNIVNFVGRVGESGFNLAGPEQANAPTVDRGQSNQLSALAMESRAFITEVRSIGEMIMGLMVDTLSRNQSILSQMQAMSSDDEAFEVEVEDNGYAYQSNGYTMDVGVSQLATNQQNNGYALPARELSYANNGENGFTLERNGRSYDYSINVSETDSNRTVQYRIAEAINGQNNGVSARVNYDNGNGQSSLMLISNETGQNNAFTIADIPDRGNAVAAVGADIVTQEARNAVYTVNGEERTSARNTVSLGNGISATFRDTTSSDVSVAARRDVEGIANTISNVVNNFDGVMQSAASLSNRDSGAYELLRQMDSLYNGYADALQDIGITRNQDGRLNVDNGRLYNAIENGSADRVLNDQGGFSRQLSRLSQSAVENPSQFVSPQARNDLNLVGGFSRSGNAGRGVSG